MRADLCASDDYETLDRLLAVVRDLGGRAEGDFEALSTGLSRFTFPDGELTVFVDAWTADVVGPDELVRRVLAAMAAPDY